MGLAKNSMTLAASSTVPARPRGISDVSLNFLALAGMPVVMLCPSMSTFCSSVGGLVSRVSIQPYATALQRTLYLPKC